MRTRPTQSADIPALQSILTQTELFPALKKPAAEGFFKSGDDGHSWITIPIKGTLDEVTSACDRDKFFTAEQAKEFGLIDDIVSQPAPGADSSNGS